MSTSNAENKKKTVGVSSSGLNPASQPLLPSLQPQSRAAPKSTGLAGSRWAKESASSHPASGESSYLPSHLRGSTNTIPSTSSNLPPVIGPNIHNNVDMLTKEIGNLFNSNKSKPIASKSMNSEFDKPYHNQSNSAQSHNSNSQFGQAYYNKSNSSQAFQIDSRSFQPYSGNYRSQQASHNVSKPSQSYKSNIQLSQAYVGNVQSSQTYDSKPKPPTTTSTDREKEKEHYRQVAAKSNPIRKTTDNSSIWKPRYDLSVYRRQVLLENSSFTEIPGLTDGVEPTFEEWKSLVQERNKILYSEDRFGKMNCIFANTDGKAMDAVELAYGTGKLKTPEEFYSMLEENIKKFALERQG